MKIWDKSVEIVFILDTVVFRVRSWAVRGISDGFPVGYGEFSFANQQWEAIGSRSFPVRRIPIGILLPFSGFFSDRFLCNPAWILEECTGID